VRYVPWSQKKRDGWAALYYYARLFPTARTKARYDLQDLLDSSMFELKEMRTQSNASFFSHEQRRCVELQ
jgi:hypothetical protein